MPMWLKFYLEKPRCTDLGHTAKIHRVNETPPAKENAKLFLPLEYWGRKHQGDQFLLVDKRLIKSRGINNLHQWLLFYF